MQTTENTMNIETVEIPVVLNDNPESKVLYKFDVPTNAMEPKTLLRYALIQCRGWRAFSKSLSTMHNLYEGPNGEIFGLPTVHEICDWVNSCVDDFDEDMVATATPEIVMESVVKHFDAVDFDSEETRVPIMKHITNSIYSRKYQAIVTANRTTEKPKTVAKRSPKAKKTASEAEVPLLITEPRKPKEDAKKDKETRKTAKSNTENEPLREEEPVGVTEVKVSPKTKKEEEPVGVTKVKGSPKTKKAVKEPSAEEEEGKKKKRSPSAYNLFISAEISRLRAENPSLNNRIAMAMAVASWKSNKGEPIRTNETTPEEITVETEFEEQSTLENALSA